LHWYQAFCQVFLQTTINTDRPVQSDGVAAVGKIVLQSESRGSLLNMPIRKKEGEANHDNQLIR
jgi:hypothetical protein